MPINIRPNFDNHRLEFSSKDETQDQGKDLFKIAFKEKLSVWDKFVNFITGNRFWKSYEVKSENDLNKTVYLNIGSIAKKTLLRRRDVAKTDTIQTDLQKQAQKADKTGVDKWGKLLAAANKIRKLDFVFTFFKPKTDSEKKSLEHFKDLEVQVLDKSILIEGYAVASFGKFAKPVSIEKFPILKVVNLSQPPQEEAPRKASESPPAKVEVKNTPKQEALEEIHPYTPPGKLLALSEERPITDNENALYTLQADALQDYEYTFETLEGFDELQSVINNWGTSKPSKDKLVELKEKIRKSAKEAMKKEESLGISTRVNRDASDQAESQYKIALLDVIQEKVKPTQNPEVTRQLTDSLKKAREAYIKASESEEE